MSNNLHRASVTFIIALALVCSMVPMLSRGQNEGRIVATTDIEMIGVTELGGGGHIYIMATGNQAKDLRQKIIYLYDANDNGVLETSEVFEYVKSVENRWEEPSPGVLGSDYRYAKMKQVQLKEGNEVQGVRHSTKNLENTDASSSESLSMEFVFTSDVGARFRTFGLSDNLVVRALYEALTFQARTNFTSSPEISRIFAVPLNWTAIGNTLWPGNVSTGNYDNGNTTNQETKIMDLRAASYANLTLTYHGRVSDSNDYLAIQAREENSSWDPEPLFNLSVSNNTMTPLNLTKSLNKYVGKQIFLRFHFHSDATGNDTGFFIDEFNLIAPCNYTGKVEMHHTDYLVGVISFANLKPDRGTIHLFRTPGGEILSYTSTFDMTEAQKDSITYQHFDFMENPQVLFILMFVCSYLLLSFQNKSYFYYKVAHPRSYRAGAKRIRWLHIVGKVLVLFMLIFYFFPSMFVYVGLQLYLMGFFMWVFCIASLVVVAGATKGLYDHKTKLIPPEPTEEGIKVVVEQPPSIVAPAPPPVHSVLSCAVCMDEIKNLGDAVRCRCGQLFHEACAARVGKCPSCGAELIPPEEQEKKMVTVECPSCGEIVLVDEGADLIRTHCEACGSILQRVDLGYNYLVVDNNPEAAYEQFKSVLKKGVTGLCISTTYPEKLRKEYALVDVAMYWLSDTTSEFATLDPRRLDFEIMRTISNFVRKEKGSVVIIDGFEYLAVENGFENALKFIKKVNDLSSINDSTLFVPITPVGLGEDELSMLKKEFDRVQDLA